MEFRIVRTKVLEAPETHSCRQKELVGWANNLVLDWVHNNIYWTCDPSDSPSTINVATMEGLDSKTILNRTKPVQSVDIDPFEGKLFILESEILLSTNLYGGNEMASYQFDSSNEEITKISLDTQRKIIYVVGHTLKSNEDRFLASLNYNGSNYQKLYTSKDSALEFGPKIVNSVVYWLTLSNETERQSVGDSVTEKNIKMEKISVPYRVNQWSVVHLESQRPADGSICKKRGCSHDCSHSPWMKITCQCPPGMNLGADNRTCSGKPEVTGSESEITTKGTGMEPAVNGSIDLAESAVDASQNATGAAGAVTASSSNMTIFWVVVTTIWISIFIVVVVVRRRSKMGNYQPAGPDERTDFSL